MWRWVVLASFCSSSLPLSLFYLQLERIMSIYSSSSFCCVLFCFPSAGIGENLIYSQTKQAELSLIICFLNLFTALQFQPLLYGLIKERERFRGKCSISFQTFMTKIPIKYPIERFNIEVVLYGSLEFNTGYNCIKINM